MYQYIFTDENKNKFKQSIYFLTGLPYENLKMEYNYTKEIKKEKKIETVDYFDILVHKHDWYYIYAMDWISQINFFHHFINNRVMFVTGSTGVGKSTQIPKLLLYGLLAIDYKSDGKTICTQPRIPPTEQNTIRIADEMGVPIIDYNPIYKENIPTDNFYLQYKDQKNNHTNKKQNFYLKMVTDGTLLEELLNSPIGKKIKIKETNNVKKKIQTSKNIYDIFIIDEAHEHNTNMDLILTIGRYAAYYNNSIRIIIISATMDDDEARYRRYFKCINDNLKYPLDLYLKENKLDRINIDRRLHISPPGQTTKYNINEIYLENLLDKQKTWDYSYEQGMNKVVNICLSTIDGDILFFVTGKEDINKSVIELNKKIPSHIVCIPYHSELSTADKYLVEKIDIELKKFNRHKDNIILEKDYNLNNIKTVPYGTYKRAVIIATNVAEASLTISSLKYIVDTGYAKSGEYDRFLRTSILKKKEISENSRLQRKGRVGRVSDGTVYYMYEREGRKKNIIEYKIANEDLTHIMYKLLNTENLNNEFIPYEFDFNILDNMNKLDELNKFMKKANKNELNNSVKDIIKEQYFYMTNNKKFKSFNYIGNTDTYYDFDKMININIHNNIDTIISIRPPQYLQDGYSKETLLDSYGRFFIVHPYEDEIEKGQFRIQLYGNFKKIIRSEKILDFFKIMESELLINYNYDRQCYKEQYKYIDHQIIKDSNTLDINYCCKKTKYGQDLDILNKSIGLKNKNYIVPYLYGIKFNCNDDILHIICMINCPNDMYQNMNKWILSYEDMEKTKLYFNEFKSLYGNEHGDYIALYKIYKNIKQAFSKLLKIYDDIKIDILKEEFNKNKNLYINNIKYNKTYVQEKMTSENYKIFKKLEDLNVLNDINDYDKYLNDRYDIYIEEIKKHKVSILKYAKKVYLNGDTVIAYLKLYTEYKYKIFYNNFKNNNKNKDDDDNDIELIHTKDIIKNMPLLYKTDDIHINILLSFISVNISKIYINVKDDMYVNIMKKYIGSLNKIAYFYENTNIKNTKYIMCHYEDSKQFIKNEETKLFIINNINIEWLFRIVPHIFYDDNIISTKYKKINNNNKQLIVMNTLTEFNNDKKNNLKVLLAYTYKLYSKNKLDIPNNVIKKIDFLNFNN